MTPREPLGGMPSRLHTPFGECPIPEVVHDYVAKVLAPGDGDTCTVMLEMPGRAQWVVTLRYEHCFAPERSQPGGTACSNHNASLISDKWGMVRSKGRFDQRSRLVGDLFIFTEKGLPSIDVSAAMSAFIKDNGYGPGNG